MQAESRERNAVVAQSDSYRSVWARDNAHYTPLEGPATVRDLPPNPLTDVEQHSGLQKVHIRAPPPERALTFGCAVVPARPAHRRRHRRGGRISHLQGSQSNFLGDLKGISSDSLRRLGTVGYAAKGLAIAGAGILVIVAAIRTEPDKATGIDGAQKTLGAQPYGAALLIAAGLGVLRLTACPHGPIQQNVSGSRGLNDVLGKVDRLRIVWSVHGYLPSDVSDIALVGRKC